MERKEYNGWTNYETWLVSLWMSNDEGSYSYWNETAGEIVKRADDKDEATNTLSEAIKDEHERVTEEKVSEYGLISDLVNAALCEVNWHEIAQHYVDDLWGEYHDEEEAA